MSSLRRFYLEMLNEKLFMQTFRMILMKILMVILIEILMQILAVESRNGLAMRISHVFALEAS